MTINPSSTNPQHYYGGDDSCHDDLSICLVCLHLLANGEYNDGTDAAETAAYGMHNRWGDLARHIIPEGTELGYSAHHCEGCGTTDHGDRYSAVLLIPRWMGDRIGGQDYDHT